MAEPAAAPLWLLDADLVDQRYKEAVAVAVKKCADDTKGQTCPICWESIHSETQEGLVRMCACRGSSGFAHVSCLALQAKILVARNDRWARWHTCGLCKQQYHGDVACALGWACWKTYLGRPEVDELRRFSMNQLGIGLGLVGRHEDALAVREAALSMERRLGDSEENLLAAQGNLADTYRSLGREEEAANMLRDVYSGRLRLHGEEHEQTINAALNYGFSIGTLGRFEEAKELSSKTLPVALRVLGEGHKLTLKMRWNYADTLYMDPGATLDNLREAVTTLEEILPTARQVFGRSHPLTTAMEDNLREARAALRAREEARTRGPGAAIIYAAAALTVAALLV